jgi:hypothetical protein
MSLRKMRISVNRDPVVGEQTLIEGRLCPKVADGEYSHRGWATIFRAWCTTRRIDVARQSTVKVECILFQSVVDKSKTLCVK